MKKRKVTAAVIGLYLMAGLLLGGCGREAETQEFQQEEKIPRIGLVFDSFVIERWQRDRDTFVSRINELGGEVYVQNANGDLEKQIEQINYFIEEKMDAIVIICVDNEKLTDSVQAAKAAGIPVVAYDRLIMNAGADLFITFNNEKVGELMAESLLDNVPENGNIAIVFGSPVDGNVNQVEEGFYRVMQGQKIKILDQQYAEGWLAEVGFQVISENLKNGMEIDGICCGNDDIASQVIKALSQYRLAGDVWVVGQDADLIACQRIVEGIQGMTVYKAVDQQAKLAAEATYALIMGEELATDKTFFDGTYEVPYIELEPVAVTKENMDAVIVGDNYHLKEDIYLNLEKTDTEE